MRRWLLVIAACSAPTSPPSNESASRTSRAIVDSHVHRAYYPVADELAANGVRAAVDLAAPESALGVTYPLRVIQSGPMLTRPGGYPLDSWGAAGYGIGCASVECIGAMIERLERRGARVIKIALDDNGLPPDLARIAIAEAHRRKLLVAVHALGDASALLAAELDADVLAHTPVESLSGDTVAAWRRASERGQRAVISTLAAFGGTDAAIGNLSRLRGAGVVVLYGTDLGNLRVAGPSDEEIALLRRAGLDDAAISTAMTSAPWQFWRFDSR
jgi:hypothetical protein